MLNIAYIGNGKSTNRYHLPFVKSLNTIITVKKVYNRQLETMAWEPDNTIQYTDNLNDILDDPAIDAVVICTPPYTHYKYALQVLMSGKHCMIEKPFTESYEQAKELFELAHNENLVLQAFQNRRYDSDFLTVSKIIESKILGELYEVNIHFDYNRPEVPNASEELTKNEALIYTHGSHILDQAVALFGIPESYHSEAKQLLGHGKMNDYFDIDLFYPTLKVSVRASYFRVQPRPSFELNGTQGYYIKQEKDRQEEFLKRFVMPGGKGFGLDEKQHYGKIFYYDNEKLVQKSVKSEIGNYANAYQDFYDVIVKGKKSKVKAKETLFVMDILEKTYNKISE
ncbi:Gfo/Idh/MocA family oxidoreductase [Erysipelothrix urinaevulpis]|uniref:Gfo/Idh/MocA family oxidoreductase n=1 Tax=Erysipelothrix urinaevulpis TaxID=2683717 RepID=UPI0013592E52|nr:Gfo/Idh/MocA family oxidoreductase [Erysipelothrix urinaevulpis]